jgi:acetoin utilization protein AcuB
MMNEPLRSIMSTKLVTLSPNDTLDHVREIFLSKRIHHLPIVEGRALLGLVTSWDLFKLGISSDDYAKTTVASVMTKKLATLEPDDKIGSAAEVLLEHLFHAIPIVNEDHELVGMVTSYDLLNYSFGKEYSPERIQSEMLTQ